MNRKILSFAAILVVICALLIALGIRQDSKPARSTAKETGSDAQVQQEQKEPNPQISTAQAQKEERLATLNAVNPGWYKTSLTIKRMVHIKELQKYQYQDNTIEAYINAESPQKCYDRLIEYFKTREDLDSRSQIPSARSENFKCEYVGQKVNFVETVTPQ